MSSLTSSEDNSVAGIWGRIVFFTMIVTGIMHGLFGILAVAKLFTRHPKLLLVPLTYLVVGAVYAFARCSILALAIALVHLSLRNGMTSEELSFYVFCLVIMSMFYSFGRIPNLYSM